MKNLTKAFFSFLVVLSVAIPANADILLCIESSGTIDFHLDEHVQKNTAIFLGETHEEDCRDLKFTSVPAERTAFKLSVISKDLKLGFASFFDLRRSSILRGELPAHTGATVDADALSPLMKSLEATVLLI